MRGRLVLLQLEMRGVPAEGEEGGAEQFNFSSLHRLGNYLLDSIDNISA